MTKLLFILLLLFGCSPTEQYTKFNIYRLEQEFPSLVQKQAKKNDLETINMETTNYKFATSRLYN